MSALPLPADAKLAPSPMTPEEKLSGDMLMLTSGFMMCAAALWLAVYWSMGYQYSTAIPLLFQGLAATTILLYWKTRKLVTFAVIQLGLVLFAPFAMQWAIGGFVASAGVGLWALLAPVGAAVILGVRSSFAWLFAWQALMVASGVAEFLLGVPETRASPVFFSLNSVAIATMGFALYGYFATERRKLLAQRIGHFSV